MMMDQKIRLVLTIVILFGLLFGFYFLTKAITQYTGYATNENYTKNETPKTKQDFFAQCLTDKGAEMYGAYWCGHCQNQKAMFGDSFKFIEYIECDSGGQNAHPEKCQKAGVTGYPTWKINGKLMPGEKTLELLANLTGCSLPK